MTCSSPRCPLRSHSLVCSKNHLFIVGIGPICNSSNLFFNMIDLIVRSFYVRWQYYNIHLWYTSFEYYLYYIVFWHISFFSSIITITTYMILFQSAYTVPLDPHLVYYLLLTIHLSFSRPLTPRLFMVVVWLYHILRQQYGWMLRLRDLHTQR